MKLLLRIIVVVIIVLAFIYIALVIGRAKMQSQVFAPLPTIKSGDARQMGGLTEMFLQITLNYPHTEAEDRRVRALIVDGLRRRAPGIKIVDEVGNCQLILSYSARLEQDATMRRVPGYGYPRRAMRTIGEGLALKITNDNQVLALFRFRDQRTLTVERDPARNFARAFASAWIKANNPRGR